MNQNQLFTLALGIAPGSKFLLGGESKDMNTCASAFSENNTLVVVIPVGVEEKSGQ